MSVSQQLVDEFWQNGFIAVEDVLSPLELIALQERNRAIASGKTDFPEQFIQIEPAVERGELQAQSRFDSVRKIWNLTKYDPVFREFARHPRIVEVVTAILGPDIKVYVDQTLNKPPRVGSAKPPHQDSAYWRNIDPPNLVICWMALDDSTRENGCMCFIPGSHKWGLHEHQHLEDYRIPDEAIDYSREVPVELKAGSCTFHHSLVWHRTAPNRSEKRRRGCTVAYMSSRSRWIGEGDKPEFMLVCGREYEGCV